MLAIAFSIMTATTLGGIIGCITDTIHSATAAITIGGTTSLITVGTATTCGDPIAK